MHDRYLLNLPADFWAHFVLGGVVFMALYLLKVKTSRILLVVLGVAIFKEYLDLKAILLSGLYMEPVKDIIVTLAAPAFFWLSQPSFKTNQSAR